MIMKTGMTNFNVNMYNEKIELLNEIIDTLNNTIYSFRAASFNTSIFLPVIRIIPSLVILLISFESAGRVTLRYSASSDWVCAMVMLVELEILFSNR